MFKKSRSTDKSLKAEPKIKILFNLLGLDSFNNKIYDRAIFLAKYIDNKNLQNFIQVVSKNEIKITLYNGSYNYEFRVCNRKGINIYVKRYIYCNDCSRFSEDFDSGSAIKFVKGKKSNNQCIELIKMIAS